MTSTANRPVRIFQVATGNVGSEMIKRIGNRDDLAIGLSDPRADDVS